MRHPPIKKKAGMVIATIIIAGLIGGLVWTWVNPDSQVSHDPDKASYTSFLLQALQNNADANEGRLLEASNLDNVTFVAIVRPGGSAFKYDSKGEIIDRWGMPFTISKRNGRIVVESPGLERHRKMPWYERMFDR